MQWTYLGSTSNDSFIINGIDIFKEDWVNTGKIAKVKDPLYGENKTFSVWKVTKGINEIIFAAGEFSNNVWGIYSSNI